MKPRIILWDIETSHNVVAVFRLLNFEMISPENLLTERAIICASWKELGASAVHSVSVLDDPKLYAKDPHNDRYVCQKLHEMMADADVLVAHNGNSYDTKFTETRMLANGLPPLPPIPQLDTLELAKKRFLFNSNKLDYLGRLLNVGRKKPTTTGLWLRILQGEQKAIREMLAYNKQDVLLLERVFKKLQPYMSNHVHRQLFGGSGECPRCGSTRVQARGLHRATTRTYQRYCCQSCGGWFRELKANRQTIHTRVL